jgi:type 1 glutamine amidotransferase
MSRPRALVVQGGWEGHCPREFAALYASLLEEAGLAVEVHDSLVALAEPRLLAGLALIVPVWTMGKLADEQERGLAEAVAAGTGLAGSHGGMGDAFRASPLYQFVVGGQFVAHPGDIREYEVRIAAPEDPIVAGFDRLRVVSEQYYMHVDPAVQVLATTTFDGDEAPWIAGVEMPVVWTKRYGAGRVFYSSIGHRLEDLDDPAVREIHRRGLLWAAGQIV